jgi:hypothetical protein
MFGLFQEKLGEVVYVQLPEVGTEVELDGKKLTVTRHGHKVMYRTTEVEIDSNWTGTDILLITSKLNNGICYHGSS